MLWAYWHNAMTNSCHNQRKRQPNKISVCDFFFLFWPGSLFVYTNLLCNKLYPDCKQIWSQHNTKNLLGLMWYFRYEYWQSSSLHIQSSSHYAILQMSQRFHTRFKLATTAYPNFLRLQKILATANYNECSILLQLAAIGQTNKYHWKGAWTLAY